MPTATLPDDDRQLDRLEAPAVHASREKSDSAQERASAATLERLSVQFRGDLVPRLRARAAQERTTTTVLLRRAAQALLSDKPADKRTQVRPGPKAKVDLRLSAEHAALLIYRARAADMTYGSYVSTLLEDKPPPPVPTHHAASIQDLRASTDRLAAMSTDLNAFVQLLGKVPAAQLEPFRESLRSLIVDVRRHLSLSAILIAELHPYRRGRR